MKLLVLGLGYTAGHFLALHGDRFENIVATVRDPARARALTTPALTVLPFDGTGDISALLAAARDVTHVLVSIPPRQTGADADPGLGIVRAVGRGIEWIGYLSTIGVYGDHGGAWIDEATPATPGQSRSVRRLEAENAWTALAGETGAALQIFRLPGIYGPGRNAVHDLRRGAVRYLYKEGQVFNRAHVDDIAAAIMAGIGHPEVGPVINVADDRPAPQHVVTEHAAKLLGISLPARVNVADAALSEMALSFWQENKRVSNRRLRTELGVELRHPHLSRGPCRVPS